MCSRVWLLVHCLHRHCGSSCLFLRVLDLDLPGRVCVRGMACVRRVLVGHSRAVDVLELGSCWALGSFQASPHHWGVKLVTSRHILFPGSGGHRGV